MNIDALLGRLDAVIRENERGLLYRDGRLVRWLGPGRHRLLRPLARHEVETIDLDEVVRGWTPEVAAVAPADQHQVLELAEHEVAIVSRDETPVRVLEAGRHILWTGRGAVRCDRFDTREPLVTMAELTAQLVGAHLLERHIVRDDQLGVLAIDGKVIACLPPGAHRVWSRGRQVTVRYLDLAAGFLELTPELEGVLLADAYEALQVLADHVAILQVGGRPTTALGPGRYALWQRPREVIATSFRCDQLRSEVPEKFWPLLDASQLLTTTVAAHEKGILIVDGKIEAVLEPGRYAFHRLVHEVEINAVDLRETEIQVVGQEVMTADKVSLRINLIIKHRVLDPRRCVEQLASVRDALYSEAQLAARQYVAGVTVDQLLEGRAEAAGLMAATVAARASEWGIEVCRIDLKDVVLPGEMKTLLNQVLEAEKKAAANLIMRREETAATRSLANTAKVLQNNPALARLKDLETLKEIAASVGEITIVTGQNELLGQIRISK